MSKHVKLLDAFDTSLIDPQVVTEPISRAKVSIIPVDYLKQWKRCGMTADFCSEFLVPKYIQLDATLAHNASFVINELLENAVKYSYDKTKKVEVLLHNTECNFCVEVISVSDEENKNKLEAFLDRMQTEDLEDLFMESLVASAGDQDGCSQMGLLTVKKDFCASIECKVLKLKTASDQLFTIHMMAVLDKEEG